MSITPMQSFRVLLPEAAINLNDLVLTQAYQPIIGPMALSLYQTFCFAPRESGQVSERLMHKYLLERMNIGMQDLLEARLDLEGIGLLRVFRDSQSHDQWQKQTLIYSLQAPLSLQAFLADARLSTLLYELIGDEAFDRLQQAARPLELKEPRFVELTTDLASRFQIKGQGPARQEVISVSEGASTFDYSRFLEFLMAEGIDHRELTHNLKEEIQALHLVYGLDEEQMVQLVRLAKRSLNGKVQVDQLKVVAERRFKKSEPAGPGKLYSDQEKADRKSALQAEDSDLTEAEIAIIILAEQLPVTNFLKQTKKALGGFPTDNEQFYVQDLLSKTKLDQAVVNVLVYYLLAIRKLPNIYKSSLQSNASHWQQAGVDSPQAAFAFIRKQEEAGQTQARNPYPSRKKGNSYVEAEPEWFRKDYDESQVKDEDLPFDPARLQDEETLRRRLEAMKRKKED